MATFELQCTSDSGRRTSNIFLVDRIALDEWRPKVRTEWDSDGGGILTPTGNKTILIDNANGTRHELTDFTTSATVGDSGPGSKNGLDGTFPGGSFRWLVVEKT